MADDIGYNDGIDAYEQWFRKFSVWIDEYNKWAKNPLGPAPQAPRIPLEGPNFSEADKTTWPWPRKFFRNTMRKLKDYYDGVNAATPPPPPPPPPTKKVIAPRTFNKVLPNGSDARFCVRDLPRHVGGEHDTLPFDDYTTYDNNGLDVTGGRDPNWQVDGLRQANSMDQFGPCDLYPPLAAWPGNMQDETGSYHK